MWFTDIVGSTELAREMGDVRWTRLLAAHHLLVREQLRAHRGREVDTAGDGFFAVFESPTEAVRCAFAATKAVQEIGLDIRAGIHFGEVETDGTNVSGLVVHTGARVMSQGGAAQVVITQTVKDLVAGARLELQERDTVELKGVPGTWTLYGARLAEGVGVADPPVHPTMRVQARLSKRAQAPGRFTDGTYVCTCHPSRSPALFGTRPVPAARSRGREGSRRGSAGASSGGCAGCALVTPRSGAGYLPCR